MRAARSGWRTQLPFTVKFTRRPAALAAGVALALSINPSAGASPTTELTPWTGGARPPFAIEALAGHRVELAGESGRVVLVHFFATWCEPCRPELSALNRLADRFTQRPLAILAIDVGEPDARVRRFFDSFPVSFPVLLDRDKSVTKAWQVSILPTTFVLDRMLRPRFMAEGDLDWDRPDVDRTIEMLMTTAKSTSKNTQLDTRSTVRGRTQ